MITPTYIGHPEQDNRYIADTIAHYSALDDVLAWKMPGAGGGGYWALVVKIQRNLSNTTRKHLNCILEENNWY